jgi:hypothetical protein
MAGERVAKSKTWPEAAAHGRPAGSLRLTAGRHAVDRDLFIAASNGHVLAFDNVSVTRASFVQGP